jgi:LPPG:FO 2-phospho-L-lactate transferase
VSLTIVALAGGIGASRFLEGLVHVVPQNRITIIGNVGDDIEVHGLHISPDLDIVLYTLAGVVDKSKEWGFRGDTFACQDLLRHYGRETWFNLGDKDLATHLYRTEQLRDGRPLSEITQDLVRRFGLRIRLLPVTDRSLQTFVTTSIGRMHFEEYMVKRRTVPKVRGVTFEGALSAKPASGVLESIREADGVIISPSNPVASIGAILAVQGIRSALKRTKARVVGISPIVNGKTVKGPADKLMRALGLRSTALGVAEYYRDFLDTLIIDRADRKLAKQIEQIGVNPVVTNTLMRKKWDKIRLARIVMSELRC